MTQVTLQLNDKSRLLYQYSERMLSILIKDIAATENIRKIAAERAAIIFVLSMDADAHGLLY